MRIQNEPFLSVDEPTEELSPARMIGAIHSRWRVLFIGSASLAALLGATALLIAGLQKNFTEASVVARLNFAGVDKGVYPNGTAFSPSDIIDTPVIQRVFERNRLETVMPFSELKSAIAITAQNAGVERLQREYGSRLTDRGLSASDRSKLEQEFESKLQSLRNGEYTLSLSSSEPLFANSGVIVGKIFDEILAEWTTQADDKGNFRYDVELYSPSILTGVRNGDTDYITAYDQIRAIIEKVTLNLEKVQKLPHANLVRVGEANLSIADLKAQLQDLLKFRMPAILGMVRSIGLSRNAEYSGIYLNEQVVAMDREIDALSKKRELVAKSLESYVAGRSENRTTSASVSADYSQKGGPAQSGPMYASSIPQFGETFLDRIVDMTNKNSDVSFRQELSREELKIGNSLVDAEKEKAVYTDIIKALSQPSKSDDAVRRKEIQEWVDKSFATTMGQIETAIVLLQQFYTKLSAEDLKPTRAYSIITPVRANKVPTVCPPRKLAMITAGLWIFGVLGFCAIAVFIGPRSPSTTSNLDQAA